MVRNRLTSFAMLLLGITGIVFLFGTLNASADKSVTDNIFAREVGSSYETIASEDIDSSEKEHILESTLINGNMDRHTLVNAPAQVAASGLTTVQLEVEAAEYTITFAVNNAGYGSVSQNSIDALWGTTYTVSGNTITFSDDQTVTATPTVANEEWTYTFTNWSTTSGTVTSDLTITANFNRHETPAPTETYTVIFVTDDESVTNMPDPIEVEDDDGNFTITIPDQIPEKEGYEFEGWTDEEGGDEAKYQPGDEIEINSEDTEIHLYPVWEIEEEEDDEGDDEEDGDGEDDEADEDNENEEDDQNTDNDEEEDNNNAGGTSEDNNGPSIHIPDTGVFTGVNGIIIASSSLIAAIVILAIALSYKISQQRKFGRMKNICANSGISIRSKDRIGQFKLNKFNKNSVTYYGISAILFLFAGFTIIKTVEGNKSQALTVDNPTLSITVPNQIELTAEQGEFAAGSINLTVSGNNPTGHTITTSMTSLDGALKNTENDSLQIPAVTSATSTTVLQNSTTAKWGITDSLDDGYTSVSSLENIVFENTNRADQYESQTPIYVGVKTTTSTTPGTYRSEPITFAATTNVAYVDYTLVYELNGGTGTFPNQTDTVPTYEANPTATYTISTNAPTKEGYVFLGWDTDGTKNSNPTYVYDSTTGTITPSTITTTSSAQSLYAIWEEGPTAKAILGSNGNLNFVYDKIDYTINTTYTDNLGETTITAVYDVPSNAQSSVQVQWIGDYTNNFRQDIATVNFTPNFYSFNPTSTMYWFYFDEYISHITNAQYLNTSNVTNMSEMFDNAGYKATTWNIDLSAWDTSNVANMNNMFFMAGYEATEWSIEGLEEWDTSKVTNMEYMFYDAGHNSATWTIDVSNWNTSSVANMSYMFFNTGRNATSWSIEGLDGWYTSKVADMSHMFYAAGPNATTWDIGDLSDWNTSNVEDMSWMFYWSGSNATTWDIGDLDRWNTSNVTDMSNMFRQAGYHATTWNIGKLNEWDTSKVTNMEWLFNDAGRNANYWNIGELDDWDTNNVTDMSNMFFGAGYSTTAWDIGDLSGWDTSNVTEMDDMFYCAGYNAIAWTIDISNWNTNNVTDMSGMFSEAGYNATTWSIGDLSRWNTAKVTNMGNMFGYASHGATTWNIGNLGNWNTSNVTDMGLMFAGVGYNATTWNIGDLSGWDTSKVTDMCGMFAGVGYNATTWNIGDLSGWDTSNVMDMSGMFQEAGYNTTTWDIGDLSGWDTSNVTDMERMFLDSGCRATIWNIGNVSGWNTSNVTNMNKMFNNAGNNANYTLNLSSWNVSNVTDHGYFNDGVESKITPPVWNS